MLLQNDWELMDTVPSRTRDLSYGTTFNLNVVLDNGRILTLLCGIFPVGNVLYTLYVLT